LDVPCTILEYFLIDCLLEQVLMAASLQTMVVMTTAYFKFTGHVSMAITRDFGGETVLPRQGADSKDDQETDHYSETFSDDAEDTEHYSEESEPEDNSSCPQGATV
jgi:hypothetical protein